MTKKIIKIVLSLLLVFGLIIPEMAIPVASASKPALPKTATVEQGSSVTLDIETNGWTVKKVKVKCSKKAPVTAEATKDKKSQKNLKKQLKKAGAKKAKVKVNK